MKAGARRRIAALPAGGLACVWASTRGDASPSHHPKEDVRYAVLRKKWAANPPKAFCGSSPGRMLVWLLLLPVRLIANRPETAFSLRRHRLAVRGHRL